MNKLLALIYRKAVALREGSYDQIGSDAALKASEEERAADPTNLYAGVVDYSTFYRKTLEEAANEAAIHYGEPTMGDVVYYLMVYAWNDMQAWAEKQVKA